MERTPAMDAGVLSLFGYRSRRARMRRTCRVFIVSESSGKRLRTARTMPMRVVLIAPRCGAMVDMRFFLWIGTLATRSIDLGARDMRGTSFALVLCSRPR